MCCQRGEANLSKILDQEKLCLLCLSMKWKIGVKAAIVLPEVNFQTEKVFTIAGEQMELELRGCFIWENQHGPILTQDTY